MNSYSRFAQYYDLLTSNVDYDKRAQYFDELITRLGGRRESILLDLGCGTGSLTECFAKMGYDCLGIDISQEMLAVALDKKFESELPIQYLHQDMTKIDLYGTVDVTICALDALNHLKSIDDIDKTFKRVSMFTNPDGLFIFDMNTIYKHKNILADNTFVYDMDDVYCVWQNTYNKKNNEVLIELDFFEKNGNMYYRSEESFSERAYETEEIDALLVKHGFSIEAHYDYDSFDELTKKSEKIIFAARKVK